MSNFPDRESNCTSSAEECFFSSEELNKLILLKKKWTCVKQAQEKLFFIEIPESLKKQFEYQKWRIQQGLLSDNIIEKGEKNVSVD